MTGHLDHLDPGALVEWRDEANRGRHVGRLRGIERHRQPKPGKARKPDRAIIETGGTIAPVEVHRVPVEHVAPYVRRYFPEGPAFAGGALPAIPEPVEPCPECGERDGCAIECPTRDDDPAAARDYIEQDTTGEGSPVLTLDV